MKFQKWQAFGEPEVANIIIDQQNHNPRSSNAREKIIITKV
jgi:hypothetical protein